MKAFKGFDENLQCRGFQYEVGKTYTEEGNIEVCHNGFHAIGEYNSPLKVFEFYPPAINGKTSRYCEVEADGEVLKSDVKICCSKLTVGAEIGIPGLVKAHVEWVKKHITNENNAESGNPATAGYRGAATSRYSSSVGVNGVAVARSEKAKVRGGIGALLVVAVENDNNNDIKDWKAVVVDGQNIKADTWYTVRDGKLVEVEEGGNVCNE